MENHQTSCPVCGPIYGGEVTTIPPGGDYVDLRCDVCGRFQISGTAHHIYFGLNAGQTLSNLERAVISHRLSTRTDTEDIAQITTHIMAEIIGKARLPHPAQQAKNLIRFIGNCVLETGEPLFLSKSAAAKIGALNTDSVERLCHQLTDKGLLFLANEHLEIVSLAQSVRHRAYDLTLDGWEMYDDEKRGRLSGSFGFIALKFGDSILDPFLTNVIKPTVKDGFGYDLYDMRDVSQAGIIDNIMRAQIRDSAFILVDLTHDNAGAYWEAGYAEGLGKPVIYLCERAKFDEAKTHFDTNHCTTVLWSEDKDHEQFKKELLATLGRSLNRFPEIKD
jgi:hypothetical protein